ncbi:virion structural protein [Pseudomonas phage PhiPA3]|uniref:Virion structural protein n=1 Tax=Pseudomonas phage PhiPA3 TaxID=998086 RepID=F8SK20_BPPA3|nr:virion structural protein [Pseudomonas phage PhiPA3]AEH03570.1 virion structural protein [Pseudomonas phage PhiPA3]
MSSMYFGVYRDDVMRLARSIVIKFDDVATQINDRLLEIGVESDPEHPETWKYYLNMSGEYHSTDVMMTVRSADTLELIDFTKENLALHRATAREYYPGSQLYNALALQYPDQTPLINGILYPIDINTAINSNNGTILYYDPDYVEDQEDNFAFLLQEWVTTFINRWYNSQFNLTDDLYLATFLGNMYCQLPLAIMNIRLRNAKTNKAHSYHITEYLASHGRLDEFMPYLDIRQKLWLYRNIAYIQRNAGKQDTWQRLVDNILTPRGIPLISYTIEQNNEDMLEDLRPAVDMVKHDVNFPIVQPGQEKVTVADLLEREDDLARDNPIVRFDAEQEIVEQMGSDQYSILETKVFDSEVIDRSNSNVRTLMSVLLNEWLHLATSDRYRAYIQVPNPRTGEYMTVSVRAALIVTVYTYCKARDIPMPTIPRLIAYDVLRDRFPTFTELRNAVPKRLISDKLIQAIQDMHTPLKQYISTEQFYLDCAKLHQEYLRQWEMYSFQEHQRSRAYCEQLTKYHYMNRKCDLVPEIGMTFEAYFRAAAFDILDLDTSELEQLCQDTINIATGSNLHEVITLGQIQRELLALMGRLTSYPLQYLRNVAFTDFHVLGMVVPRVGDITSLMDGNLITPVANINVRSYRTESSKRWRIYDDALSPNIRYRYDQEDRWRINPFVEVRETSFKDTLYYIRGCDIGVRSVVIEPVNNPNETGDLPDYKNSTDANWPKLPG